MPLNDDELDQLFRDRLRDHHSPVRADLWRRIHNVLRSQPALRTPLHNTLHSPLQNLLRSSIRFITTGTGAVTAATAAVVITLTITRLTHPTPLSHYSIIKSTTSHPKSATPHKPDRTLSNHPTPDNTATTSTASTPSPRTPDAATAASTTSPRTPNTTSTSSPRTPVITRTTHHHSTGQSLSSTSSTLPTSAPPFTTSPTSAPHRPTSIQLPALAHLTARPAITSPRSIAAHTPPGNSKTPVTLHSRAPYRKRGYISVYGSPDFPNKDYDYSWTTGARYTWQFAHHWSLTSGFQYEQLNVPYADRGGTTTMPFHFSNYSIPLLAGYSTEFNSYTLTITGGALINLSAQAVGSYRQYGVPGDRNGHFAVLGFDIDRPIADHWAVFIQPYAREVLFNGEIYIPSKTISTGVLVGARYHL